MRLTFKLFVWGFFTLFVFIGASVIAANFSPQVVSDIAISQMERSDAPAALMRTHTHMANWICISVSGLLWCGVTILWWWGDVKRLLIFLSKEVLR